MISNENLPRPLRLLERLTGARRLATPRLAAHAGTELVIRSAQVADRDRLELLGELDSKAVDAGTYLLAELDGELVAALPIDNGEPLADPFRALGDVLSLLTLRRAQLRSVAAVAS